MAELSYPDALPAFSHLHWYVLERVLGQGGFGITYLAKDTNLDQHVAIKEYLPVEFATRLPDSSVRARTEELRDRYRWGLERFIQEARTLARFDHPNIVRVLSVFEFQSTAYIVMRFEQGGTLAAMLDRRGTLPEAELARILLPVLDGLELVHDAGFIHRDIKPDNIHISGDGRPVLLDFGSARQAVGSSTTLTILIAPGYAPFEQYYNDPSSQGPWTDIYGLGATAYRAICGRAPLDAVSRSKGILGSTQEIMVPASVVGAGRYSGHLLAAIDHALAFAEADRPQTIPEWRRELVGDDAAPMATPTARPRPQSAVRTATAQPTILTEAPTDPRSVAVPPARSGPNPSRTALEPLPRGKYTPPWAWVLVIIAVAVAAVAVYTAVALKGALESEKVANIAERNQPDRQQPKAFEQAPPKEIKQPTENEPNAPKRRDEPSVPAPSQQKEAKPSVPAPSPQKEAKPSVPAAPPQKEAKPSVPAPQPQKEAKPSVPAPEPAVLPKKEAPPIQSPPEVPKEKETGPAPPPSPKSASPLAEPTTPAQRPQEEPLQEATRLLSGGHIDEAIKLLKPLGDGGNAKAQALLGDAYADRDLAAALVWYERAANGGDTGAMLKLGAMYASGKGVEQSNYLAYIWYCTAARLGSGAAKGECTRIASFLQPAEQKQAAKVIASEMEEIAQKVKKP